MKPKIRKILALVIVVAVGAVAGPWVYINLIRDEAPEALTLEPATTTIGRINYNDCCRVNYNGCASEHCRWRLENSR